MVAGEHLFIFMSCQVKNEVRYEQGPSEANRNLY